jgi:hypothetical protein
MATISLSRKADEVTDSVLRITNKYIKPTAHLCLVSTFIEDGIRMFFQWGGQIDFFKSMLAGQPLFCAHAAGQYRLPVFLGHILVLFLCLGQVCTSSLFFFQAQIVPCGFILSRKAVRISVFVLGLVVLVQVGS